MKDDLIRYATGQQKPAKVDRALAAQAKAVMDQVRIGKLKKDGSDALAADIMDGWVSLNRHRQMVATGDPFTDAGLMLVGQRALDRAIYILETVYGDEPVP